MTFTVPEARAYIRNAGRRLNLGIELLIFCVRDLGKDCDRQARRAVREALQTKRYHIIIITDRTIPIRFRKSVMVEPRLTKYILDDYPTWHVCLTPECGGAMTEEIHDQINNYLISLNW